MVLPIRWQAASIESIVIVLFLRVVDRISIVEYRRV